MKHKHKLAYLKTAEVFAECSAGTRLKVGAVVVKNNNVIATGYNALPIGLDGSLEDENGKTRPEVRHAEMNALFSVMRSTNSSVGSAIFCTHACCRKCAVEIVDAGITKFFYRNDYRDDSGLHYLRDNNVEVEQI